MVYGLIKKVETIGFNQYNCVSKSNICIPAEGMLKEINIIIIGFVLNDHVHFSVKIFS